MKKNYLLFIFCFITYFTNAQAPFITTWEVLYNQGTIDIPILEDDDTPDSYTIDFGDGTVLTNQSGEISHTYENAGIYTVTLSGNFTRIHITGAIPNNSSNLLTIEQWGDIQWTNMEMAFRGCYNVSVNATDIPNLTNVTDMTYMFGSGTSFTQSISNWDVSNVVLMKGLFSGVNLTQSINNWNVSNVTNMSGMFSGSEYNQPLDNWDVSNVTNMSGMFYSCDSFNQPINNWDVSNVTDMSNMFGRAFDFNQPLNNWDVSGVTTMRGMFNTTDFNQPLDNWDVSNVTDMKDMFWQATSFNQPIDSWDVSNVTDMSGTFLGSLSFNQPLNSWDVSNVTNMEAMFLAAISFNYPIGNWDISNVVNIGSMFCYTTVFNQDLSDWNFNTNVTFENLEYPQFDYTFLGQSGLDVNNYDALLNRFKELGLENKNVGAEGLRYCDEETRTYLINELGWNIEDDSLAEDCTAKTELFSIEQLSIYPNPVNNILHIETKLGIQLEAVTIYNLQGSQLIHLNQDFENINTESLSSGIYILSIQTDKGSTEYKLIKN